MTTIDLSTDQTAAFGIKECRDHELVTSYPILVEKEGERESGKGLVSTDKAGKQ